MHHSNGDVHNSDSLQLRSIDESDIEALQEISIQTFSETFGSSNSQADMELYLSQNFNREQLLTEVRSPDCRFYFVSTDHDIAGYIKINIGEAQTVKDNIPHHSIEIERIYVRTRFHGMHIGRVLLERALDIARQHGANTVWLGVWEKNERAIRFYTNNGFTTFGQHVFKLGHDDQIDLLMKRNVD